MIAAVEEVGVDAWTTRLSSFALVAGEETSAGMMMAGIDPEREPAVSILDDRLVSGRYLVPGDANAALLGTRAARKLRVGLGDDIVLLSTDRFGAMAAERLEVVGLFATGDPRIDEPTAFVTLAAARAILAMEGRITDVVIQLPESKLEAKATAPRAALGGQEMESCAGSTSPRSSSMPRPSTSPSLTSSLPSCHRRGDRRFRHRQRGAGLDDATHARVRRTVGAWHAARRDRRDDRARNADPRHWRHRGRHRGGLGSGLVDGPCRHRPQCAVGGGAFDDLLAEFAMDPVIYPVVNTDHLVLTAGLMIAATVASAVYSVWRAIRLEPVEAIRHV